MPARELGTPVQLLPLLTSIQSSSHQASVPDPSKMRGPQTTWGEGDAQGPDAPITHLLAPLMLTKYSEILGELSLAATPSPVPSPHVLKKVLRRT